MDLKERAAAKVKFIGGRLCLDFVNTVGGRIPAAAIKKQGRQAFDAVEIDNDKFDEYADLLAWGWHAGVLDESEARRLWRESRRRPEEAGAVLRRAVVLREALYRLFKSLAAKERGHAVDLELLNEELAAVRASERLVRDGDGFVWRSLEARGALDKVLFAVTRSAAELLTTGDLSRLRECGGAKCGWLFEDTSKNRSRQWCDMKDCGNLAKVRRFRARQ